MNAINEWINKKETDINRELFEKHFKFQTPSVLAPLGITAAASAIDAEIQKNKKTKKKNKN